MNRDDRPIDLYRKILEWIDAGRSFAAAVVLCAEGSTPQQPGARALIDAAGAIAGTVGGGWVEARAQAGAVEVCRAGRAVVLDMHLDNAAAEQSGPICGGSMRILLDPTVARHRECFARAADALDQRRRGALLTEICTATPGPDGPHTLVRVEWLPEEGIASATGPPGPDTIRSCLERESPRLCVGETQGTQPALEVFVEPVVPRPLLLIAGGGHVGRELAGQAVRVGFDVIVLDDRPEFADPGRFPAGVTARSGNVARELAALPMTPDTYVALVTRGHQHDAEALAACLRGPAGYVGMIGSRRKVSMIRKGLLESGLATEEEFDRVFAPIGLELGAVTVPEIAASIVAELIAVRRLGAEAARSGREVSP